MGRRRKKPTWEERVVQVLHLVRLHQMTEYDPVQDYSLLTRFVRYNLAYFDFDKESTARPGPPVLTLTERELRQRDGSVNVASLRILLVEGGGIGYPIMVSGTMLVRDQVDYKCVYLFRRGHDNPQPITSPEDTLALTDPSRGLAVTCSLYFEIDLKMMRCDDGGDERVLSRGVIEHNAVTVGCDKKLVTKLLTSWHSTVWLEYTHIPVAAIATLSLRVLHGVSRFIGDVVAWTTRNDNQIVLHDTPTELGADGSVALTRRLMPVPVNEELVVRVCLRHGDGEVAACFEGILDHLNDRRTLCQGLYVLQVTAEWAANTTRQNVYRNVGRRGLTRCLV